MKEAEEKKKERLRIAKMSSIQLVLTFEQLIRDGAGYSSTPLMWYRDEILDRCVVTKDNLEVLLSELKKKTKKKLTGMVGKQNERGKNKAK